MSIYETATKLANEIKNSKEYIQFRKYMQEVKKDSDCEKLLAEYKVVSVKVQNFMTNNPKEHKRNLAKYEQQFTAMMAHINQILSQAVENDYK